MIGPWTCGHISPGLKIFAAPKGMLNPSTLMITTVKNIRGYRLCILNLILSFGCLAGIAYCGFNMGDLLGRWYIRTGLAMSLASFLHQVLLISYRRSYTRLEYFHTLLAFIYFLTMCACIIVPVAMREMASLREPQKTYTFYLLVAYGANLLPLIIFFVSLYGRNEQLVQNYLHPFSEIIDGFSKSQGSIQMTAIPSTAASGASLKQVVISEGVSAAGVGDAGVRNSEKDVSEDKENDPMTSQCDILSSHKADGTSPKPSQVLKLWPKADPFPVRALYTFKTESRSELPFRKGDTVTVLDCRGKWWQAQKDDRVGFIPSNYVSVLLKARVSSTFTASEDDQVSVMKDQIIEVMEKYEEKCLVRTVEGKIGAVPTDRLDFST